MAQNNFIKPFTPFDGNFGLSDWDVSGREGEKPRERVSPSL
jgi:hypothetical protein